MSQELTKSYEESLGLVHLGLEEMQQGVCGYEHYLSLVHESGLIEALNTIIALQPESHPLPLAKGGFGCTIEKERTLINGFADETSVTIRSRQLLGGNFFWTNLYLRQTGTANYGDIASANYRSKTEYADTWDGYRGQPRTTVHLNRVLELGRIPIEQLVSLATSSVEL